MDIVLIVIWLGVWFGLAVFFACMGETDAGTPMFFFPLLFGFVWPLLLAFMVVTAPLFWLSERATKKADPNIDTQPGETT